ncbi:ABC transporter ATP-binding protein [uncultured Bacteroides sp.]|uniref:ABC transporter ATP-binding protein n=1 Tax=uncultured Bacteroides sp. TaxID=162156 RepID=UPI0025D314F8|nr:ABC transporter ATP-binding protein [uncultured Bacteroides sp.]
MEKAVIIASDLCIGYRSGKQEKRIHEHLSFRLYPGELTCLLGANGTGKSTLLRTLAASQPALSGELLVQEKPLSAYSEKERSRTIGVVLTDKTQAGGLTVYELVALGRQPHTGFFGRLNKSDHAIIEEALEAVGISHKAQSYTAELSDGERQKVMIAKALVQECPLILLDEPTAFLDVVSRIEIMTLLHRLAVEQNKAILLSTHDIEQALVLADKLWLLSKENGLQCGVTEDMILSHRMDSLFSRNDIRFDYAHGVYYPKVDSHRNIIVEANDEVLLHWTTNALNRHGYACCSASTAGTTDLPRIQVLSAEDFRLYKGKEYKFHSFEQLLANV